jgi:hypothetical protein
MPNILPIFTAYPTIVIVRVRAAFTLWRGRRLWRYRGRASTLRIQSLARATRNEDVKLSPNLSMGTSCLRQGDIGTCWAAAVIDHFFPGVLSCADLSGMWHCQCCPGPAWPGSRGTRTRSNPTIGILFVVVCFTLYPLAPRHAIVIRSNPLLSPPSISPVSGFRTCSCPCISFQINHSSSDSSRRLGVGSFKLVGSLGKSASLEVCYTSFISHVHLSNTRHALSHIR